MDLSKIFPIVEEVNPQNFEAIMQSAIALELATIPTYLSTYYSINRAQNQEKLHAQILNDIDASKLPAGTNLTELVQELTVSVLVHANKTAALTMSVVIEEMLHLSLASNVKQAIIGAPEIMDITKVLTFPAFLKGHEPEFYINAGPLSPAQLNTFLQIESPKKYVDPADPTIPGDTGLVEYNTIGGLYNLIIQCVNTYYDTPESYTARAAEAQLVPDYAGKPTPYYSQNSVNTVHYDKAHDPKFASEDDSGGMKHVVDAKTAVAAMNEIKEQGEGNDDGLPKTLLTFDSAGMPVPMIPDADGNLNFLPGDYDDDTGKELSHFAKFMEAYSMGVYHSAKFAEIEGLKDFYSYFVYNQAINPKQADYDSYLASLTPGSADYSDAQAMAAASNLGNAIYTYIILMVETCYHVDEQTQFQVFMYGIHKAMIWLLSGVGNFVNGYTYVKDGTTYQGSLSFEYYDFSTATTSPKAQIETMVNALAAADATGWGWTQDAKYQGYWQALPDVGLDHSVVPNVPAIPAH